MTATAAPAMAGMEADPLDLLPEILLAVSAVLGLLLGSWLPRHRQWPVGVLAAAACTAGAVSAAASAATSPPGTAFGGAFALDTATATGRVLILAATSAVLGLAAPALRARAHPRETEFYVLLQLAALGALVLTGTQDLLLLAAGYLLASLPAYALTGFRKDAPGTEAALKYYVFGALLGILMLSGITALLAAGHGTAYSPLRSSLPGAPAALVAVGTVGVLAGLLFKAGGVPAHYWVPDAVQGSAPSVAAFLTTVPKIGALVALFRLVAGPLSGVPGSSVPVAPLLAAVAVASMTLGNLAAFQQDDVRRLLAYSTISQVGYLLLPVAVAIRAPEARPALLFYLAGYAVTNLGAFAVVCALPRAERIEDYRGLARRDPLLVLSLVVCLLGLVGTPPTAVFLGKLEAFTVAFDGGYVWLAAVAAANTLASLFYYLRWIAPAFRAGEPAVAGRALRRLPALLAYVIAGLSLALGLAGGPVLDALGGPLSR